MPKTKDLEKYKFDCMAEEAISSAELSFDNDVDTILTDPKASKGIWSLCGDDKRLITALVKKEKIKLIEEIKAGLPEESRSKWGMDNYGEGNVALGIVVGFNKCRQLILTILEKYEK